MVLLLPWVLDGMNCTDQRRKWSLSDSLVPIVRRPIVAMQKYPPKRQPGSAAEQVYYAHLAIRGLAEKAKPLLTRWT